MQLSNFVWICNESRCCSRSLFLCKSATQYPINILPISLASLTKYWPILEPQKSIPLHSLLHSQNVFFDLWKKSVSATLCLYAHWMISNMPKSFCVIWSVSPFIWSVSPHTIYLTVQHLMCWPKSGLSGCVWCIPPVTLEICPSGSCWSPHRTHSTPFIQLQVLKNVFNTRLPTLLLNLENWVLNSIWQHPIVSLDEGGCYSFLIYLQHLGYRSSSLFNKASIEPTGLMGTLHTFPLSFTLVFHFWHRYLLELWIPLVTNHSLSHCQYDCLGFLKWRCTLRASPRDTIWSTFFLDWFIM